MLATNGIGMQEAWIPLECIDCGAQWERTPSDLPAPGNEYECDHCDVDRPIAEFVKTQQGFKILKEFYR